MKKFIKKTINKLGFDLKKINSSFKVKNLSFNDLLKDKISKNPVIFDIGANQGQSIERFLKIFNNPIIHSFEPIKSDFDIMYKKYKDNKNIYLNNFALGNKTEEKEFNITAKTETSSFNKITLGTDWLKARSKKWNTTEEGFVISVQKVSVKKLDDYCKDNRINLIDLMKIDTQGYEDKVLEGSINTIEKNKIKAIETEIIWNNVYDKYFSFFDLEKYLIPNNFRMVGLESSSNNLFSYKKFDGELIYFNKKYFDI